METSSSESCLTGDEVVVVASRQVSVNSTDDERAQASRSFLSASKPQLRHGSLAARPDRTRSPLSVASKRRTPDASPVRRSERASDDTPSRAARFSVRDEVRDSQSPPPSIKSTAHQQPPTPQPSTRPSRGHQTPNMQTPKRVVWTVDKITSALIELSEQVGQGHARLVDYVLEEAEKKARQPSHFSKVDHFASMQSIALDPAATLPPKTETMGVKFKASGRPSRKVLPGS